MATSQDKYLNSLLKDYIVDKPDLMDKLLDFPLEHLLKTFKDIETPIALCVKGFVYSCDGNKQEMSRKYLQNAFDRRCNTAGFFLAKICAKNDDNNDNNEHIIHIFDTILERTNYSAKTYSKIGMFISNDELLHSLIQYAIKCLKKAIDLDKDVDAMCMLGDIYCNIDYDIFDIELMTKYYEMAIVHSKHDDTKRDIIEHYADCLENYTHLDVTDYVEQYITIKCDNLQLKEKLNRLESVITFKQNYIKSKINPIIYNYITVFLT